MKQLTQQLKSGKMQILDVPFPVIRPGYILVRNHYSVISPGTEGKTVADARKGYVAKAKSRQKEFKQVMDMFKTQGMRSTYDVVMNKLEAPSPLGYSCIGKVLQVAEDIQEFQTGDYVACGGSSAVHAEVVSVPKNLCVRVNPDIDLKQAAFTTIASIAIQGIRQSGLMLGENCIVIGLGLIGQLTLKILEASGINAYGIDISEEQIDVLKKSGLKNVFLRDQAGLKNIIINLTNGNGTDAVIITASSNSTDPVNFAGEICRKKGKVVIVGVIPTGFDRENYYKKELEIKMSASYGPGRYDPIYEEKGIDYPVGYVRWTEKRNMSSFVEFLDKKKISVDDLITHTLKLDDAPKAYNMIMTKSEYYAGILIEYNASGIIPGKIELPKTDFKSADPAVGFIGTGSFAQNVLLPKMKKHCEFVSIITGKGNTSRYIADKYNFRYATDNVQDLFNDENINTIFIATRHNLHAGYVIESLKNGKNVFVEKPLALNLKDLNEIQKVYGEGKNRLMVGFNRRFAPSVNFIKERFLPDQPKAMNFRINAGSFPPDNWVHDPEEGGGRILGDVCHFIDLAVYLAGSKCKALSAFHLNDSVNLRDSVVINMSFKNGSIASINYFSNGNKSMPKEYLEVFCNGECITLDDYKELMIYGDRLFRKKFAKQDKGHETEIFKFLDSIKTGKDSPVPFEDIIHTTLLTLSVNEALSHKKIIEIN
jgi:predicted dehydrogenase/threonine dehydrogenase-like Zn-dependent dehydrogenase